MFAKQNRADDVRPWAIMRMRAPAKLQGVWIRIAAATRPMWPTEEYAIRDLRSVWRRQIEPVIMTPHRAKIING